MSETTNTVEPDAPNVALRSPGTAEPRALGQGRRVAIIGAGFSGLASAFFLVRAGFSVEIFEQRERVGGLISTLTTADGPVETAANAFLNSSLVEELFATVGVPLIGTKPSARRRFILRDGVCRRWPIGFMSSLRVGWFVLRYILARSLVSPRERETVRVWARRVLGDEASAYLVDAFLQGIYAGDPARMSAKLIFGRFFARAKSSLKRRLKPRSGIRGSVSAPGGMGQLMTGLRAYLESQGVRFHLGLPISSVSQSGASLRVGRAPIIVATGPHQAAQLLEPVLPATSERLKRIEMNPVTTTTAFFAKTDSSTQGFGVLFAPREKRAALGVLKNNFIFDGRPEFSETWIQGGALVNSSKTPVISDENHTQGSNTAPTDETTLLQILRERRAIFHLEDLPKSSVTTRWPKGIPHYTLELEQMIPELEKSEQGIFLMGNYLGDLGLAKILERAASWPERLHREGQWS